MSLWIGVGEGVSMAPAADEPWVQFEDAAAYWFLHPLLMRLAERTGPYVDLYGNAVFQGDALDVLRQTLADARRLTEAQPASWEVIVGEAVAPVRRTLTQTLERAEMLETITAWERVVCRAEALDRPVVCFGD